MSLSKIVGTSVLLWAGAEVSYFLWKTLSSRQDPKLNDDCINTVLFFDSRSPECFLNDHNIDNCQLGNCPRRNMRVIEQCLQSAKSSIDIAMYKLSSIALSSYLVRAIRNGVTVRVFSDTELGDAPTESRAVIALRQAGAFVRIKQYDRELQRYKLLMHHKFVVIDKQLLITGSLNWTATAVCGNWEDAALISDPTILQKFHAEFEYLWDSFNTAGELPPPPANPPAFPSDMSVWKRSPFNEVYMFSETTANCRGHMSLVKFERQPEHHAPVCAFTILRNLAGLLETAERSIDICVLLLNLENIADVLLQAFYKGIRVRMISDIHMASLSGSQIRNLIEEGVEVRGRRCHSSMHHKFIILDDKLVVFGSFNWSMQALCGNCENLVCSNNEVLVDKFKNQFSAIWNEFQPIEVERIGFRRFD